jgi:lipid-binding SYLF domain-containing protein
VKNKMGRNGIRLSATRDTNADVQEKLSPFTIFNVERPNALPQLYPFREALMKKRIFACAMSVVLLAITGWADDKEKDEDRLKNAGTVLTEILNIPDDIPQDLLDKADCVVVFPSVLKAAFVVGGSYGRGAMTCRRGENFNGAWGAPSMMALEGGSVGFQIGGQATDFVLLVMNDRGANGILSSKVKLGADASVAAGPVGRNATAETDASMRAEILSYSRARGLFAGISLEGSTIRPDNEQTRESTARNSQRRIL